MKLPYCKRAYISEEKLANYILSETHAIGKLKAKFFRSLGFNENNISGLKQTLLNIAYNEEVKESVESIHGIKFIIDGKIQSPSGKTVGVRTVWIIEPKQKSPRFITTYPL